MTDSSTKETPQYDTHMGSTYLALLFDLSRDISQSMFQGDYGAVPLKLDVLWATLLPELRVKFGEKPSLRIQKAMDDYENYSYRNLHLADDRELKKKYGSYSQDGRDDLARQRGEIIVEQFAVELIEMLSNELHALGLVLVERKDTGSGGGWPTPAERMPTEEAKPKRAKATATVD